MAENKAEKLLGPLIEDFSLEKAVAFLRGKFSSFDSSFDRELDCSGSANERNLFKSSHLIGYIRTLPEEKGSRINRPVLVAAVELKKDLNERSHRQIQFSYAKKVLQEAVRAVPDGIDGLPLQGIFFFYDKDGFFRLSLITGSVEGRSFRFGDAKRQSFFVDPNKPNNTLKSRFLPNIKTFADLKEAFSVESLTKDFYEKLFTWYEWATSDASGVSFPEFAKDGLSNKDAVNLAVIRLITRLMFTWFLRQKNIVPHQLFEEEDLADIIKEFDPNSMMQDSYYRCILQNLFFATFNCQPEKRRFMPRQYHGKSSGYNVKTLYRYENELVNSTVFKDEIMARIPFLNCALFDCLDKKERQQDGGREYYWDGFSDHPKKRAHLPNGLFFDHDRGILPLFSAYEFTIDENNADDCDIALDPELLGKVFENLLGAYNPETRETARKATGSFYTPRDIVDYMVESSLRHYLQRKVPTLSKEDLDDLFDKEKTGEPLSLGNEKAVGVRDALYECKILDPACGSGAFPMGILHCMVRLFDRLDPKNLDLRRRIIKKYREERLQFYAPQETVGEHIAALELQMKEGQLYPDYARKLYLIENCIYGVDIQPIAAQISKLRFFISLLCDQLRKNRDEYAPNCGLLSLPNLEAKFVCADTLKTLPKSEGIVDTLETAEIRKLREILQKNRHQIFCARTASRKQELREKDLAIRDAIRAAVNASLTTPDETLIAEQEAVIVRLRQEREAVAEVKMERRAKPIQQSLLGTAVEDVKYEEIDVNAARRNDIDNGIATAQKLIEKEKEKASEDNASRVNELARLVASWDPYDQNACSPFFDPAWMFNLKDGFDIVIGNPPYIQLQKDDGHYGKIYEHEGFATFCKGADLYCLFTELGERLLRPKGTLTYIMPNKWMVVEYGRPLRRFLAKYRLLELLNFGDVQFFEKATNYVCILMYSKESPFDTFKALSLNKKTFSGNFLYDVRMKSFQYHISNIGNDSWSIKDVRHLKIIENLNNVKNKLIDLPIEIYRGVLTGYNKAFYINEEKRNELIKKDKKNTDIIVPIIRGKYIKSFFTPSSSLYMIATFPALHLNIDDYPLIKEHLLSFGKTRLEQSGAEGSRKKTNNQWFETQDSIAYYSLFAYPKIIYPNMTSKFPFCYDEEGWFVNQKCFIMTANGDKLLLKFLTAVLNSKLAKLWMWYNCPELAGGTRELSKVYFQNFPICSATLEQKKVLADCVDRIIAAKKADAQADIRPFETEINTLVYQLYSLTKEEMELVEQDICQTEENQPDEQRNKNCSKKKKESAPAKRKSIEDDDEWLD